MADERDELDIENEADDRETSPLTAMALADDDEKPTGSVDSAPSAPAQNPFFAMDPPKGANSDNPFFAMDPPKAPDSSALGAFTRRAGMAAIPAAGALPGFIAGMEAAAPLAGVPVVGPALPVIAGLAGGFLSGNVVAALQNKFLDMFGARKGTGLLSEAQEQSDVKKHPYASLLGEMAPNVGLLGGAASGAQRLFGAGLGAAQQGVEQYQRGEFDPTALALAAAGNAAMGGERGLGAKIGGATRGALDAVGVPGASKALLTPVVKFSEGVAAKYGAKGGTTAPKSSIGVADSAAPPDKATAETRSDYGKNGQPAENPVEKAAAEAPPIDEPNEQTEISSMFGEPADKAPTQNGAIPDAPPAPPVEQPAPVVAQADQPAAAHEQPPPPEQPPQQQPPQGAIPAGPEISEMFGGPPNAPVTAAVNPEPPAAPAAPAVDPLAQAPSKLYPHPDNGINIDHTRGSKIAFPSAINKAGTTVYISNKVPTSILVDGKQINPAVPLATREIMAHQARELINKQTNPEMSDAQLKAAQKQMGDYFAYKWMREKGMDPDKVYDALGLPRLPKNVEQSFQAHEQGAPEAQPQQPPEQPAPPENPAADERSVMPPPENPAADERSELSPMFKEDELSGEGENTPITEYPPEPEENAAKAEPGAEPTLTQMALMKKDELRAYAESKGVPADKLDAFMAGKLGRAELVNAIKAAGTAEVKPNLPSLDEEHSLEMSHVARDAAQRAKEAANERSSGTLPVEDKPVTATVKAPEARDVGRLEGIPSEEYAKREAIYTTEGRPVTTEEVQRMQQHVVDQMERARTGARMEGYSPESGRKVRTLDHVESLLDDAESALQQKPGQLVYPEVARERMEVAEKMLEDVGLTLKVKKPNMAGAAEAKAKNAAEAAPPKVAEPKAPEAPEAPNPNISEMFTNPDAEDKTEAARAAAPRNKGGRPQKYEGDAGKDEKTGLFWRRNVDGHVRWLVGDTDAEVGTRELALKRTKALEAQRWALKNAPDFEDGKPKKAELQKLYDEATERNGGVDPVSAYTQTKARDGRVPAEFGYLKAVKSFIKGFMSPADFSNQDFLFRRDPELALNQQKFDADTKLFRSAGVKDIDALPATHVDPEALREEKDLSEMAPDQMERALELPPMKGEPVLPQDRKDADLPPLNKARPDPLFSEFGEGRDRTRADSGDYERGQEALGYVTAPGNRETLVKPPGQKKAYTRSKSILGRATEGYKQRLIAKFQAALAKNEMTFLDFDRGLKEDLESRVAKSADSPEGRTEALDRELARRKNSIWTDESGEVQIPEWLKKLVGTGEREPKKGGEVDKNFRDSFRAWTPRNLAEQYARSLDDRLFTTEQKITSRNIKNQKRLDALVEKYPEFTNKDVMQRLILAHEADDFKNVSPEEKQFYQDELKPILKVNEWMAEQAKKLNPKLEFEINQNHVHRVAVDAGDTDETGANPVSDRQRSLYTSTAELMERSFMALTDGKQREVVSANKKGQLVVWRGGSPKVIKGVKLGADAENGELPFKAGTEITTPSGKTLKIVDALMPEIEANGRFKNGKMAEYQKNLAFSALKANGRLYAVLHHMQFIEDLKTSPAFKDNYASTDPKKMEEGWKAATMPQLRNWYLHPKMAQVFEDYTQPGVDHDFMNTYRKVAQAVTKTIFFNPVPHLLNVATHWFVGRGLDWLRPGAYKTLIETGQQAIKSVWKQDSTQTVLRNSGAGTIYGGVYAKNPVQQMAKVLDITMKKNPTKFATMLRNFGLEKPADLVDAVYNQSAKVMWAANDMFLTQRILELQQKGMTRGQAITEAERHIPNYRVPAEIMGSRWFSNFLQEQGLMAFGRYHYGVFNSYSNIAKDLRYGNYEQRKEAAGNIMAMGMLAFMVYPMMDKIYRTVTGNESAEANRRGPITLPNHIYEALAGKGDLMSGLKSSLTVPPLPTAAWETMTNKDFAGRNIMEPYDVKQAAQGNLAAGARVVGQQVGHLARGLVAPYGQVATAYNKGQNPLESVRDQFLDIKNPSDMTKKYRAQQQRRDARTAGRRFGRPRDPIEAFTNKLGNF